METRKIALACFIGGALCCGVALMVAPVFWWFGLFAGLAGGYVSYEFREFIRAIPVAFRAAKRQFITAWNNNITSVKNILANPFFGFIVIIPLLFTYPLFVSFLRRNDNNPDFISLQSTTCGIVVIAMLSYLLSAILVTGISFSLLIVGCESAGTSAEERFEIVYGKWTYAKVCKFICRGIFQTIKFLSWTMWKYFSIGIMTGIRFLGCFSWRLFKLIHSEKRLLCAIDGTLGGALSYIWLASAANSFAGGAMMVIFGGLIGAALGVVNWEIVSKRILHIAPANGN